MRCDGQLELQEMSFYAILVAAEQGTARGDGKTERGISAAHGIGPACEVGARKHGSGASEMWGAAGRQNFWGARSRKCPYDINPERNASFPSAPEPSFVIRKLGPSFFFSLLLLLLAPFFSGWKLRTIDNKWKEVDVRSN